MSTIDPAIVFSFDSTQRAAVGAAVDTPNGAAEHAAYQPSVHATHVLALDATESTTDDSAVCATL